MESDIDKVKTNQTSLHQKVDSITVMLEFILKNMVFSNKPAQIAGTSNDS